MRWPGGARLAVSIVVNIEEGAELSLSYGDERNEHVYEAVEKVDGAPDLCMESHFTYGTRAGWPRIRALLKRYGVRATLNACGRAIAYSPWIATEAIADGHEVASHGFRWERQVHMAEADERAVIAKAVAGREKDRAFVRDVVRHGLVNADTARDRLAMTTLDREVRRRVEATFAAAFASRAVP